ncbi:MAG: shikimate kinase [Alistipes sp.]|nr:shikimate kinase [Alistipes sp.]
MAMTKTMARKVFLVGFMGCGKSSVGRRLAATLKWDFVDTDKEIERLTGKSVAEIFATQGEERFRELEWQTVEAVISSERDTVVALGGGTPCRDGAMERLSETGRTVYLKSSPARLVARMSESGRARRPKIAGMNDAQLAAYIEKTLPEREKYYNKANFVVDCDALGDAGLADRLASIMRNI